VLTKSNRYLPISPHRPPLLLPAMARGATFGDAVVLPPCRCSAGKVWRIGDRCNRPLPVSVRGTKWRTRRELAPRMSAYVVLAEGCGGSRRRPERRRRSALARAELAAAPSLPVGPGPVAERAGATRPMRRGRGAHAGISRRVWNRSRRGSGRLMRIGGAPGSKPTVAREGDGDLPTLGGEGNCPRELRWRAARCRPRGDRRERSRAEHAWSQELIS